MIPEGYPFDTWREPERIGPWCAYPSVGLLNPLRVRPATERLLIMRTDYYLAWWSAAQRGERWELWVP